MRTKGMGGLPGDYKGQKYECDRCGDVYYELIQPLSPDRVNPSINVCPKCNDVPFDQVIYHMGGSKAVDIRTNIR